MRKKKLNITIIGAGKIAHSLSVSLISKHNIDAVISRSLKSAQLLAKILSVKKYSDDLKDIPKTSDLIILSVPDDQIEKTSLRISKQKISFAKKTFIHLSGSENIDSLSTLKDKGADVASVHIMQTFSSKKIVNIKNCFAAVECDNQKTEKYLFDITKSVGLKPFRIFSAQKSLYHLSGVFASNFLTGNFYAAGKIYSPITKNIKLNELLGPITERTLKNILTEGTVAALSGPVERGDITTIKNHLEDLKSKWFNFFDRNLAKLILAGYLVQSLILLKIAEEKSGKLSVRQKKLERLFRFELKKINF